MQINFRFLPVLTLAVITTFTACKKDSKPDNSTTEMETQADDQNRVSTQIDAATNDASFAIESAAAFTGRVQGPSITICDATISFDTANNQRKATIIYDGSTTCNGSYSRTGTITVSMSPNLHWKDQGAQIALTYQNLKITRTSDKKSITINGSHTITNLSGGLLFTLSGQQSITHAIASDGMSITFDDGSTQTWKVARRRVYTKENNKYVLSITGDHTDGTNDKIAEWGLTRFGHAFTTSITEPLVIREDCFYRLTSGEVKHEGFGTATATFGLDANGNPTACPGLTGHYYFKLVWTGPNGASASATLPY